ncbi:MAG: PEGA domain-containing protein [Spirochaetaceae bacterium]|jgi:hypothetical protein|nr:PEGA domain-containing protein [Spirochaetaceae bacterium]
MQMRVQALNEKGELLENAEVFINGVSIGRTPNTIAAVSGAIWKSYTIKVRCDGYNDVQVNAEKEPKWFMIILGIWFLWFLWLWAYGAKELQTVVMYKKAENDEASKGGNSNRYQQFVGKTWQDVLRENNFEHYISMFESHKLTDIDTILSLNEQDLEKIGIESLGDRKRLLMVLQNK